MPKYPAPELSIIVPCLGAVSEFENTLASLLRYRAANTQVVAVHDGSYQDPHGIGGEVEFVAAPTNSNLGGHLGIALRQSSAPVVGMIRPGVQIVEGWQDSILDAFEDQSVASVSPLIVDEAKPNRILTAGVDVARGFRRKFVGQGVPVGRKAAHLSPLGPSSWAAFYRRNALDRLGTPDPQMASVYLDLDIALGLNALGLRSVLQTECVFTVEEAGSIIEESTMPHGNAAARANLRFGTGASTMMESVIELATVPFKPWLFKHVMGKFSARSMQEVDSAYRRRLETRVEVDPAPFEIPADYRRAA